jgi:hypothetical protein
MAKTNLSGTRTSGNNAGSEETTSTGAKAETPVQSVNKQENVTAKGPTSVQQPTHVTDHVKDWLRRLTILHRAHWDAARYYDKVNLVLGISTVVLAAISGTTAFTQLQKKADEGGAVLWLQIGVGVFAMAAAVLGAVQAFYRSGELAARHKQAAQKFGKLRRELDQHFTLGLPTDMAKRDQMLTDFRQRWDIIDEESPAVPKKFYDKVKNGNKRK